MSPRTIDLTRPAALVSGLANDIARKHQRTDNEIITLDDKYDLTLVVGTATAHSGVKTFRINSASLRLASAPFKAMLGGPFAESSKAEINFPDDAWEPFLTFLQIAHMKIAEIPETMSKFDLVQLARFCDNYDLGAVLSPFVMAKNWLGAYNFQGEWALSMDCQYWAFVANVFQQGPDCKRLTSILAEHLQVDSKDGVTFYLFGMNKVPLRKNIPDGLLKIIHDTRSAKLEEIHGRCKRALESSINRPPCRMMGGMHCTTMRIGIIVSALKSLGLYNQVDTSQMHQSVLTYRKGLSELQKRHEVAFELVSKFKGAHYAPIGYERTWTKCMGDFDLTSWN